MKAQLFILAGRDVGRSFDIGDKAVLGRGQECDIRLRDRSISRKHAVVRQTDAGWVVEDLGSRNGVKVRGERVPDAELLDHDEFYLGDLPVRFRLPEAAAPEPPPLVAPAAPDPPDVPVTQSPHAPVPAVDPEQDEEIQLEDEIVLEGELELEAKVETVMTSAPPRPPVRLEPMPGDEEPVESEYERRRKAILRDDKRTGFLRGDLSQQPFWVKAVVGVFVTALAVGLAGLAFWSMQKLRGSL